MTITINEEKYNEALYSLEIAHMETTGNQVTFYVEKNMAYEQITKVALETEAFECYAEQDNIYIEDFVGIEENNEHFIVTFDVQEVE